MGYNGKYLQGMGWTLVVMGSLSIIMGIAADVVFAAKLMAIAGGAHYISAPIWNGIFVVITGVLAIRSGKKPTNEGLMVALMILGIFTILSAACCFSLNIVGWYVEGRCRYYGGCNAASIALHVVNVLLSLAEIVMAFVAAIMPCCGLATSNNPHVPPRNELQPTRKYNGKYLEGMGWTLVVMGSLNIILGIAADVAFGSMGAYTTFHYMSAPIWNGFLVVITGVLAICSGKKPTNILLMVALMILGIFTILSAACCFSLGIAGSIINSSCGHGHDYGPFYGSWIYRCDSSSASIALHVVNALLSLAEIVMAFVAAIMPCCGLASSNNPHDPPVVVYNQGPTMMPDQAAYVVVLTGVPGAQGVPYTTGSAAGGLSQQQVMPQQQVMQQQQVFIAQHPYPAATPMQGYCGAEAPPPYMPQSNIGAAAAESPAAAQPPAQTKIQQPAYVHL